MPRRTPPTAVPDPDRATDEMIRRCRVEIESTRKALARRFILPFIQHRFRLGEVGEGFQWGSDLFVAPGSRIGRYAYLGPGFFAPGPIVVGDMCMIAAQCRIVGADHRFDIANNPTRLGWPADPRKVTIFEADAWVGERVTIMEGVRIGAGAVVGSASTVLKDVLPYTIVAGTPARYIRERFNSENQRDAHDRRVRVSSASVESDVLNV